MYTKNRKSKILALKILASVTSLLFIVGCNTGTPTIQNSSVSGSDESMQSEDISNESIAESQPDSASTGSEASTVSSAGSSDGSSMESTASTGSTSSSSNHSGSAQSSTSSSKSGSSSVASSLTSSASSSASSSQETDLTLNPIDAMLSNYLISRKLQTGKLNTIFNSSILLEGDSSRIVAAMKKAMRGEPITIAAIGGSITAGAFASSVATSYSSLVYEWWKKTFPDCTVKYYNYGIAATGSVLGAHRLQALLLKKPDFVIIDFAVNDFDTNTATVKEAYESMVRKILSGSNNPGILLIAFTHQNRINTQALHKEIADRYNLPFISFHDAVWGRIDYDDSSWTNIGFFADAVHPNGEGHKFAADLVINKLIKIYNANLETAEPVITSLPSMLTKCRYLNGTLLINKTITPLAGSSGWVVNNGASNVTMLSQGWDITGKGSAVEFSVTGKTLILYYDASGGHADIKAVIDGTSEVTLPSKDGNALKWASVYAFDESKTRTVRLENITEGTFTLYALLVDGN